MDGDCELGGSSGVVAEEGSSGAPAAQEDEPMETTPSSPAQDDTPTADDATGDVTTGDVTKDNDTAATEASNSDNGTGSTTETEGVGAVPKATTPPRSSTEENDDDVVLVEEERNHAPSGDKDSSSGGGVAAATKASTDCTEPVGMATADGTTAAANATTTASSSSSSSSADASPAAASDADATASSVAPAPGAKPHTEPIVIDDEEEAEHRAAASSSSSSSQQPATLASTEPDSEIKIASVTTLGAESSSSSSSSSSASVSEGASAVAAATASVVSPLATSAQGDMNLMITSVTSLQGQGGGGEGGLAATGVEGSSSEQQEEIGAAAENGLQISSTFSLNPDAQQNQNQGQSRPSPTFNPGRVGTTAASQPVQNGETGTHQRPDSWISQSASFPRNQKQPGVDSPSPAASLAKPPGQSGQSGSQQPPRTVKVTCANCKKPLKKGQTAYQRKGSSHLFCSTPCLSAFSHKPQPKKHCTMCKKDITSMKGTIVAQVDSSESFQEFCSTGCLAAYENKQATPKSSIKTKCTVCGKLTEIRHEVSFKNVTHKICSDACFNRYRMANGLVMNCCEQCGNYLPSRATAHHYLQVEGQQKRFCSPACIRDYKQVSAHGKMTACTGCKVLCRSFDVTQCIGPTGAMEPYCSTACMNKTKAASVQQNVEPSCHFCKRNALPQYQATMPEGKVLNFCSSHCVTKFQSAAVQTTNGQTAVSAPNSNIQLKCNYCRGAFSLKPETLEWENKVYQFCSKACCEDYKKLHCIVAFCENCHEEKTLHETAKISGVSRPFCGEGCKLLFKQSFARRLGLKCVTCNHCEQMCKRSVTRQIDNVTRDFCSEPCAKKFHDWYYKAARCDCCKVQGNLTESVQWRAEMKHFCDQQCLLRFYLQQNEPNMNTQKGPENTALGIAVQTQGTKVTLINQAPVAYAGGGILKDVKNKAVLCKPLTMTKATYCKPHMQSKQLQTDEAGTDLLVKKEYVPVPIPVPVYVPVPMNLYAQATPAPVTLPIPVPVPVFLPTTLQSADEIVAAIKELKAKLPPDILATLDTKPDLIEVKSEEDSLGAGPQVKRERVKSESSSDGDGSSSSSSSDEEEEDKRKDEEEEEEDKYEADLDLENDFPLASEPVPVVEGLDAELNFTLPPVLAEEKDETSRPRPKQKGAKRQAVGGEGSSAPGSPGVGDSDSDPLQPRYGLNAWRRWASSTKQEADALTHTPDTANAKRGLHVKTNLLSMKAGRLGQALSRFVREVRRPNGERYTPDSILYLCLGIQKYLQDKGRTDDLFSDACYSQFGEELNKILKDWQPSVLPDGSLWGRVQERCLWDSGHLGESSPVRLLRSLVYLNTKYFGLRTVEQHLRLSFANVYGPSSTDPVTNKPSIRIRIPSIQQDDNQVQPGSKRKRQQNDLDPDDGSGGAGRCPVKKHECQLYEAYLSKCPVSVRKRADMFYMQPEASGVAGSDASPWFGSTPLDRVTLEMLLTRVLLVRDIYEENHPEEEEEGEAMEEEAQKDPDSGRG